MNETDTKRISKLLSLVLRHEPEKIGIPLDSAGWTPISGLLAALTKHGHRIDRELLEHVVRTNDKQRFTIDTTHDLIRANQGHSVEVELGYSPSDPPEYLLHGTPQKYVESIRSSGLHKRQRHHVHLHCDSAVASAVGARRGAPVLLRIRATEMVAAGHVFFVTDNQVWLTDHVPPEFIDFPENIDETTP